VVFEDADMDALLPVVVNAIVQNAGQTCSAGSRLLVQRGAYEQVLERLAGLFSQLAVGSSQMDLDCGPLIRKTQQERVAGFLSDARRDGIALVAQGEIAPGAPAGGFYQAPALLRDVPPQHRLAQEEVFGPVLAAMSFEDEAEAIALANGTDRPGGQRLDPRRRPPVAAGARHSQWPGLHQQLWRRWRRGTALRWRQGQRPRARGIRGPVWLHGLKTIAIRHG
jgi:acyl-CoA reductase-like NAD-dependent aldehyde dehydrogenase